MDNAYLYNTLSLAYLGDAAYEVLVRNRLVSSGKYPPGVLHKMALNYVSAISQSKACDVLLPMLNEQEQSVFQRARNSNPVNIAKHASRGDYHKATALEAVFGYNYLLGNSDRLNELFEAIYSYLSNE